MSFQDKSLRCADCGATFTFTAGEQEFYQTKGYVNQNGVAAAVAADTVPVHPARCIPRLVLSAVRLQKSRLHPAVTNRFIAAIASALPNQPDSNP